MTTATKTAKPVNYTPEQVALMVSTYTANKSQKTVEALAAQLGKTVRSIVARLAREKNPDGSQLYVAKAYVSKTGAPVAKKDDTADAIGKVLNLAENDVSSLTKATKPALAAIWKMIVDADNRVAVAIAETKAAMIAEYGLDADEGDEPDAGNEPE